MSTYTPSATRLRYYLHDSSAVFRFTLTGTLEAADTDELEVCRQTAASTMAGKQFLVDVTQLREIDDAGRQLLAAWRTQGASLVANAAVVRPQTALIGQLIQPLSSPASPARCSRWLPRVALLFLLLLPLRAWAVDSAAPSPAEVLARYTAGQPTSREGTVCGDTTIEIEAALPKLEKRGRLRAVQHFLPANKSSYEVTAFEGDQTIRQEVIARYLAAEQQAGTLPADSLALTPANYKFRYNGALGVYPHLTYVFQISPRHKRVGLLAGEIWLDAVSGALVREAGRFVKTPSVFLRRAELVQDALIHDGQPSGRVTHLIVETRLVGRAELVITAQQCNTSLSAAVH